MWSKCPTKKSPGRMHLNCSPEGVKHRFDASVAPVEGGIEFHVPRRVMREKHRKDHPFFLSMSTWAGVAKLAVRMGFEALPKEEAS